MRIIFDNHQELEISSFLNNFVYLSILNHWCENKELKGKNGVEFCIL